MCLAKLADERRIPEVVGVVTGGRRLCRQTQARGTRSVAGANHPTDTPLASLAPLAGRTHRPLPRSARAGTLSQTATHVPPFVARPHFALLHAQRRPDSEKGERKHRLLRISMGVESCPLQTTPLRHYTREYENDTLANGLSKRFGIETRRQL